MPAKKKPTDSQLKNAMRKVYQRYRHRPNFTGADIGYRWEGETRTDEKVVRVHVDVKIPLAELDDKEIFPAEVDGIPLDVIEGPYKARRAPGNPQQRAPVLSGGISVGRSDNGAGTLGAIVMDEATGRPAMLSNWHVLAGPRADHGDAIRQPGRADGGGSQDVVATLSRWELGLDGDAAVAELTPARPWLPTQINSNSVFSGARNSRLNEVLVKHGRTTGKTRARVDGEGIYRVFYEVAPGVIEPRDIEGFKLVPEDLDNLDDIEVSEPGDSGSVWFNQNDNMAIGLHFAGERETDPRAERAIACNMPRVLKRLKVRLAGMDDLAQQVEALSTRARSASAYGPGTELTPHPDWPDWPYPPRWPFPPRGPLPGPWPGPRPCPLSDPRDLGWSDPREFGSIHRRYDTSFSGFGNVAQDVQPEWTTEMWRRLRESLWAEDEIWFANVRFNSRLDDFWQGSDPAYEIATIIRRHGFFADVIPPDPYLKGRAFEKCVTFRCVCVVLAEYTR